MFIVNFPNPSYCSYSTVILANNLSPGYIRIAGPSTEHLQYYEEDGYVLPDSKSINSTLNFTGPMLGDVIEWFASVNMTPVFAVNDVNGNNPWNPEEWRPIFEAVAELNNTCYWQMGWSKYNQVQVLTFLCGIQIQ